MQYALQFLLGNMDNENSSQSIDDVEVKKVKMKKNLALKIHAETLFSQLKKIALVGLCLKVICVFKWLIYR